MSIEDKIVEVLKNIDEHRLEKLAKFDGDFKSLLQLVKICKYNLIAKNA